VENKTKNISHVTVQAWHCTDIRYQPLYTDKCDVIVFKFRIVINFKLRSMVFMNQMLVKTGIKTYKMTVASLKSSSVGA